MEGVEWEQYKSVTLEQCNTAENSQRVKYKIAITIINTSGGLRATSFPFHHDDNHVFIVVGDPECSLTYMRRYPHHREVGLGPQICRPWSSNCKM